MTRQMTLVGGAVLLAAWLGLGCDKGKEPGQAAPKATQKAAATAAPTATSSAATKPAKDTPTAQASPEAAGAPKGAAGEFFSGESPSEVKLITGYVEDYENFDFAIKTPEGWKGAGQQGWGYMAMRKDSKAALFCDIMGNDESYKLGSLVTFKEIQSLAKRAPIMGKDLVEEGPAEIAKVGKLAYPARVGHAKGNLFGAAGGDLFWIDLRHQQTEGPWHLYCIMAVKKDAGDEVMTEAKAVMRSLEPPRGKKVLEPKMD